jgi:hypothetical protein
MTRRIASQGLASLNMTTPHRSSRQEQKNSPRIADRFMAFLLGEPKVLRRFKLEVSPVSQLRRMYTRKFPIGEWEGRIGLLQIGTAGGAWRPNFIACLLASLACEKTGCAESPR